MIVSSGALLYACCAGTPSFILDCRLRITQNKAGQYFAPVETKSCLYRRLTKHCILQVHWMEKCIFSGYCSTKYGHMIVNKSVTKCAFWRLHKNAMSEDWRTLLGQSRKTKFSCRVLIKQHRQLTSCTWVLPNLEAAGPANGMLQAATISPTTNVGHGLRLRWSSHHDTID